MIISPLNSPAPNPRTSRRLASFETSSMAMACGMPLPSAAGKNLRVSQAMSTSPTGVSSNGSQGHECATRSTRELAYSLATASAVAITPISTAPPQNKRRTPRHAWNGVV